jgi:UDP-2,3-diacylglucosamine pyrophosphatase LpxH
LRRYEAEYLFLIGDIIDFWAMSRGIVWSEPQNTVVQKVLRRARHGEKVIFVPGNHDEALREYDQTWFGGIHVVERYAHVAADGRRYLLIHGDEFDQVTRYHRWAAKLGDVAYDALVRANTWLSALRRTLRIPGYWSLAGYAKHKVKTAIDFIFDFEDSVVRYAKQQGYDGVICGHVHCAASKVIEGVRYINCGDWVDSCTGIVEHLDGQMEVIHWGRTASANTVIELPGRAARAGAIAAFSAFTGCTK